MSGYDSVQVHGRGGIGAAYKGWRKNPDRFVAIKILPPGVDDGGMNFADRFKQEAKATANPLPSPHGALDRLVTLIQRI